MHTRRYAAALIASTALLAGAITSAPGATAAPGTRAVPNTKPTWLGHARHLGPASPGAAVAARVYLAPRGGLDAVKQAAAAVSTPGSASYRQFLTTAQYRAQFGTTSATVQQVASWLSASGLHVTGVGAQNRYVSFTGTARAAQKAFGTSIQRYQHDGQTVQAPSAAVTVPSTLAADILTVSGLDTTKHQVEPANTSSARPAAAQSSAIAPPAGFRNARPCSRYFGQIAAKYQQDFTTPLPTFDGRTLSYAPCGYTGPQFRAAYEANSSYDGSGVTVAITDAYASPTIAADAERYAVNHGDGAYSSGQFTQTVSTPFTHKKECDASGWFGEESLDVEAVHAMAPGANIHYYGAASCYDADLLDSLAQVVDDNTASLVTNSWGEVEEGETADSIAAYENVFLQGAVQGISFMFSSGDNGDELASSGIKQADYPTSDPYVTSVGGTATGIGASGALSFETGWGTVKWSLSAPGTSWTNIGFLYGAGGGASGLFNKPAYQNGVVPGPYRQVPDVAMDADPNTGMLIGLTQTFPDGVYYDEYRIGGTSLASPLFAGITALSLQHGQSRAGLLNYAVYGDANAFNDVGARTPVPGDVRVDYRNGVDGSGGYAYSVRTFNQDSSLVTGAGWDDVTGLGTASPRWITALSPTAATVRH